jgi:hypothetical protein
MYPGRESNRALSEYESIVLPYANLFGPKILSLGNIGLMGFKSSFIESVRSDSSFNMFVLGTKRKSH